MVCFLLLGVRRQTTDATAQKVNANKLSAVAVTEMALPGLLWSINFDCRCLWRQ
jgi:hypothetical protein